MIAGFLTSVESRPIAFIIKCSSASKNFFRLSHILFSRVADNSCLVFLMHCSAKSTGPRTSPPRVSSCFVSHIARADSRWFLNLNVHVTIPQKALPDNLGVLSYTRRRMNIAVAENLFVVQLHSQSGRSVSGMVTAFVDPSGHIS